MVSGSVKISHLALPLLIVSIIYSLPSFRIILYFYDAILSLILVYYLYLIVIAF